MDQILPQPAGTSGFAYAVYKNTVTNEVVIASFAPPAAGQTILPPDYQNALGGVITANWQ